ADWQSLPLPARRRFLKLVATALAAPAVPAATRFAVCDMLMGTAYAQEVTLPTYFIEINLRDQWDQGHVFVAPGLATAANQRRGTTNRQLALYYSAAELRAMPNRVYLTAESAALAPHIDSIAMFDTGELSVGAIHGHEAANPLRSPGRSYAQRAGTNPMWLNDPVSNFPQGVEAYFSSTPTPASLHNFYQKRVTPGLRNGFAFKGIRRSIHTTYHYGAGLPGAELDRFNSVDLLLAAFPDATTSLDVLPNESDANLLTALLRRLDSRFFATGNMAAVSQERRGQALVEAQHLLHANAKKVVSLPLTDAERAYWSAGVPPQSADTPKANIWEQAAYAFKLISNDIVRSVALEFDYVDVHDTRNETQMRTEAAQTSLPLARLIESLKLAGLYERTVIAMYTLDGSRAPAAGSEGDEGKNTL
ncbi:MAG TPA: hypothetical protein VFH51_02385, partial [Myxococcota bacterium]|nr:hypothetical protein [Myxococcota bacterium]